jgi:hypothetical protein
MNRNNKYIDDLFKEELGNYTETPPPAIWDRLEKKLDSKPPKGTGRPYRKLWYFGVLSFMLLLTTFVAKQLLDNPSTGIKQFSSKEITGSKANMTEAGNRPRTNDVQAGNEKVTSAVTNNEKNDNLAASDKNLNNNQSSLSSTNTTNGILSKRNTDKYAGNNDNVARNKKTGNTAINKHNKNKSAKTARKEKTDKYLAYNNKSNKSGPNTEEEQPENEYGGSATDKIVKDGNTNSTAKQKEDLPAVAKKETPAIVKKENAKNNEPKFMPKPKFKRFEAGIKAGYETGFDNDAAKKVVVTPYVQYKITSKLAIMLQPAVKSSYLSSKRIGGPKSYYKINSDSNIAIVSSYPLFSLPDGTQYYLTKYHYTQTHDSIVKSNFIEGTYMEYELPVLLKYYLGKKLSVYGGVNITYSKFLSITEHTSINQKIPTPRDTAVVTLTPSQISTIPVNSIITYQGTPISSYTGPQYPVTSEGQFRFGYTLGFSYEYGRRWLVDALIQQAAAKSNVQGGYNTNTALSAPYIRFTLGYKLTK